MFPLLIVELKELARILLEFNMCKFGFACKMHISSEATYIMNKTSINNYKNPIVIVFARDISKDIIIFV